MIRGNFGPLNNMLNIILFLIPWKCSLLKTIFKWPKSINSVLNIMTWVWILVYICQCFLCRNEKINFWKNFFDVFGVWTCSFYDKILVGRCFTTGPKLLWWNKGYFSFISYMLQHCCTLFFPMFTLLLTAKGGCFIIKLTYIYHKQANFSQFNHRLPQRGHFLWNTEIQMCVIASSKHDMHAVAH